MSLDVDIRLTRGELVLDARFQVAANETVALLGPNGAGKTSCLLAIAGLLALDGGRISLSGRVLEDASSGFFVSPSARHAGVVFQDHLLFPRLTVIENVAYGMRSRGRPRRESLELAASWLERVGIKAAQHRSLPSELSGGQAQRVALARALAPAPLMALLDEPLAAVDASARVDLRRELRAHLASFDGPRVLVVHDLADALALSDRIVVLEEGRVVQSGSIDDLLRAPRTRYVADLVGLNSFEAVVVNGVLRLAGEVLMHECEVEGEVLVAVHPRAVALSEVEPRGPDIHAWRAPILGVETALEGTRVQVGGSLPLVAELSRDGTRGLDLRPGQACWVAIDKTAVRVAPRRALTRGTREDREHL